MVGYALKKLAKENNLTVSNGIAYGSFHGYTVTFFEGAGTKTMAISTRFDSEENMQKLVEQMEIDNKNIEKEFRVMDFQLMNDCIIVVFHDNPGTMPKIYAFIDWFFPLLAFCEVPGADYCSECGQPLNGTGTWKLINGIAFHIHEHCASRVLQEAERIEQIEDETNTGSYASGFAGAFLGSLVGGIIWAIVLYIGYYAAVIGLLIGILAKKGYERFHGRKGIMKLPIVLITTAFGVIAGTFLADIITLFSMVHSGELYGLVYSDIFPLFIELFNDSEYISYTFRNIGAGLFFALLGIIDIIIAIVRENKKFKMKSLN